ncbi:MULTISPECIES: carbohydrate ABC transporter permease [unclassified Fusibacter]|uniref:carbohydrate ABC transporter permease n=1 Tax=unclassified Fusibacter TaxID=2624464 RepID=UPI00101284A0|nr:MULTISPECIES: carbohydrate ABC transporter permease [unclassified Fusibacter]MCK8061217.1 carbohydrate ABC transporter permease [Fusibacter sp. A2]NPE23439.1 carbohydrate ABC transporter permease [Fusibacter sp. A1]RXV59218.1 carbohydrate ABC transporter permease [Fusibacter sp. A1]
MSKKIATWVLGLLGILFMVPLVHLLLNSFMGASQINSETLSFIPESFDLQQYYRIAMYKSQYFKFFFNSVKITGTIIGLQLLISVTAAYAFAKLKFVGRNTLFAIYLMMLILPFQVTFVPNYLMMKKIEALLSFQLLDTHLAIILPGVFSSLGVFLLRQFIMDIPDALIEAARIDGASEFKIFYQIILPTIRPAVITLLILIFIDSWNVIEQAIVFIESADKMPLSVFLESIYYSDKEVFYAGAVLFVVPVLYLFNKFEKYLEDGFSIGGRIV